MRNRVTEPDIQPHRVRRPLARFALISILLLAGTVSAGPRLTVYEDAFNFGFLPRHVTVSHDFWLFSTGDSELEVLRVVPGCGCTQAPLEKKLIPMGDSARLEIIFRTLKFTRGLTKRPTVQVNDGRPEKEIQIIAHVLPDPDSSYPIGISPWHLLMEGGPGEIPSEIEFVLTNKSSESLMPELLVTASDWFDLHLPEVIPASGTATGSVRVKETHKNSSFEKSATFQLNDKDRSRFTLPVKRLVKKVDTLSDSAKAELEELGRVFKNSGN